MVPLSVRMDAVEKRVHAFVRVKPTAEFAQDMIKFGPDNKSIAIYIKKDAKKGVVNNRQTDWAFRLDGVLHNTSQELAYETVAKKVVSEALVGYNGTIMCYGQTGAGKTYTMTGATAEYEHRGIIPRAIQQVFKATAHSVDPFKVRISYLEIYNETLFDLLSTMTSSGTSDMQMAVVDCPQGVYVKGLSIHSVSHEEDALNLFFEGETNRVIAEHTLNKNSSRSHCIFTIYIESRFRLFSDVKCVNSKINLIDLAGSERLSKTGSEGQVLKEATYINKSLSFLEQIVIALADPKRDHIPFRQSKLTHVLKDSLGGNCNTVLVANICGEAVHVEETLSSLRFATRMKWITTEPVLNETCDREGTVKALEKEIILLKQELAMHDSLANHSLVSYDPLTDIQIAEIKSQVHKYLKGATDEIDAGVVDVDGHLVQEEYGQTFGTRISPFSSRHGGKKKSRKSNEQPKKEGAGSCLSGRDQDIYLPSKSQVVISAEDLDVKEGARNQDTANVDAELSKPPPMEDSQQPSSPPPKPVAFEQFKEECGSEINRIFKENKSILLARKKRSSTVAQRINFIKHEMEGIKKALEAQKQERWQQGEYVDEKGQIIIDEKEFSLIMKLKDLKEEYRSGYAELQDLKAEIQYCQHLVDQCRNKLVSEFEIWYNESFLIPKDVQEALKPGGNIRPGMIPINRVMCLEEDEQERFERMQERTLPDCPASVSFYKAKMRMDQKHTYTRAMSSLEQMRKKPGLITAAGKNKPLSFLHVT
ncbi:kinesin-like protein KIF9 isoform X3 [Falco biarmicus]|uniref:kinesin-like protein KIF9 isoform X4 n=1 Tax=Falco rusticolus TaxID=120794 RepID=UPI000FFC757F|nr:kinesin-like protein KIF9 isoform X4 [Falco rusticolus]XP_055566149.1 kinesin-like protein KIF9 isoform X3 [Falco cherrug]XP_056194439.1 kinesin-like protein KIF9 isoform X3 [Falco biarmicus]